jgi:hypothetical protein
VPGVLPKGHVRLVGYLVETLSLCHQVRQPGPRLLFVGIGKGKPGGQTVLARQLRRVNPDIVTMGQGYFKKLGVVPVRALFPDRVQDDTKPAHP